MKRAASCHFMSANIRNRIAADLFAPRSVASAIDEAASLGYRSYRVTQDHPFDLSDTEAAKALERWLASKDFQYIWRNTYVESDPLRPAQVSEYAELVIMW